MKKLSILILVFLFNIGTMNIFAAEPQTQKGSKALFFVLNGLSDLSVNNSSIGFQYLFQDKLGFLVELGFNSKNFKPYENAEEEKYNTYGVAAGLIYYAYQKGPVAFYLSPELGFSYGSQEKNNTKVTYTSFYGGISVAAEWWAFENVSFGATSFIGFQTEKEKNEAGSVSTEATTNSFGILGSQSANLFINFYF